MVNATPLAVTARPAIRDAIRDAVCLALIRLIFSSLSARHLVTSWPGSVLAAAPLFDPSRPDDSPIYGREPVSRCTRMVAYALEFIHANGRLVDVVSRYGNMRGKGWEKG